MKKIIIFSLDNLGNGGDEMLGDTTEYLVNKSGNYEVERAQLKPHYKELGGWYAVEALIGNGIKWLSQKLPISQTNKYRLYSIAYRIQYNRYYAKKISGKDAVIYALGMLKYSTQNVSYVFELINRQASKKKVSVLMNAMSIEQSDKENWRYWQLVRAVNMPCVKMITTRDGKEGVERLRKDYIRREGITTDYVGDPALWAPECYNIIKHNQSNSPKLGIGLVRTNIFESYKGGVSSRELYSFYKELIKKANRGELVFVL